MKKKRSSRILMKLFLSLFLAVNLILTVIISDLLVNLFHRFFETDGTIPDFLWVIIICLVLGSAVTSFLSRFFFKPILKLEDAMAEVADGNFEIRLEEKNDLRDIRNIYSDFNSMAEQLSSTEILQTEFISNVSHEFKTPINAIEGYATLLQDYDANITDEQREYIDKIMFNTKRLTSLVGNILLMSKVDSRGIQLPLNTYRLDEQIRQSIVSLESRWTEMQTEFDVDMEDIEYTGYENMMMHVFTNLIENAIKYGPVGGLIKIKLIKRENKIIFTVEDEGDGISEEDRKHIFDRFYQADNSRRSEGNGLGLALVKRIVKLSMGDVTVESLPVKGTCFTVTLPSNLPQK